MRSLDISGLDVSRETLDRLQAFADLTAKWTKSINLVSANTVDDIWDRHIRDSAQLVPLAPTGWKSWIDLGSGGGFPGIVVALLAKPEQHVVLVESDVRKATFLRTAIRETDASARVVNARAEAVEQQSFDVVSARALAPLPDLLTLSRRFIGAESVCLFPKGRNHAAEINEARTKWRFDHDAIPSITDADARILRLTRISERGS